MVEELRKESGQLREELQEEFFNGKVIIFNKPLEWTSTDVVNKIKIILRDRLGINKIKAGHAGTLDPLATGVLVICTGKATKTIDSFLTEDKSYITTIKLGASTVSFDMEHPETVFMPYQHITEEEIRRILESFTKEIYMQMPPIFSAKKIKGKRAYQMARDSKEVILSPVEVSIKKIELLEFNLPYIKIAVFCSKGTYIRSLARDIGERLTSCGYIVALERVASGNFKIEDSITIQEFENSIIL